MSKVEKKKSGKERKKRIILALAQSFLLIVIGTGIPTFFYIHKNVKMFHVWDIHLEQVPIVGIEINMSIMATHPYLVPESSIRTTIFPNRCAKTLHIWVFGYTTSDIRAYAIHVVNQTLQYTFPTPGSWQLIAGEYTTNITVS